MSLVGCSGEEFAQILRSLGFRMERRARPASPASSRPASCRRWLQPHRKLRLRRTPQRSRNVPRARSRRSRRQAGASWDGLDPCAAPPDPSARHVPASTGISRSGGRGTPGLSGLASSKAAREDLGTDETQGRRRPAARSRPRRRSPTIRPQASRSEPPARETGLRPRFAVRRAG